MGTLQTWRKAYGALKDHTKVGLAQINSDFKDVDVAIVKATNHVECPPKERYIRKILVATSAMRPRADVAYCIHALARRLAKTHNWTVALKTLIVVHRTLREGDPTFREEFLNFQQRGRILQLSNFKDDSSPIAWDCSAWVRTYALFLEERLECFRILKYDIEAERLIKPGQGQGKGYSRTREVDSEELLEQLPALQQLLYRLIGCRPEGAAVSNYIIQYALALVLKESFKIYCAINDGIINLFDKFFEMPRHEAMKALDIYKRAGQQAGSLSDFYDICKGLELTRNFQFPALKGPPQSSLATMEEYIREAPRMVSSPRETLEYPGMLHLTYKPEENSSPSEDTNVSVNEPQPLPTDNVTVSNFEVPSPPTPPNNLDTGDLLGLSVTNPDASAIEDSNALALAIIPSDTASSLDSGAVQAKDFDPTGWELALVTTPSSNMSSVNERQLLWVYAYFPRLAPVPDVETPLVVPFSRRFDVRCVRRPRETFIFFRRYFDTITPADITWRPWAPLPAEIWERFAGAVETARFRILLEGPVCQAWYLGERFLRQTLGLPEQIILAPPPADMRETERYTLEQMAEYTVGWDAIRHRSIGDYTEFIRTFLMRPLSDGRRAERERPAAPLARAGTGIGAGASRRARVRGRGGAQRGRGVGWPALPTTMTYRGQGGATYQIPFAPPPADHELVGVPDLPPASSEYTRQSLELNASMMGMLQRTFDLLALYSIPPPFQIPIIGGAPVGPSVPARGRDEEGRIFPRTKTGRTRAGSSSRAPVPDDDDDESEAEAEAEAESESSEEGTGDSSDSGSDDDAPDDTLGPSFRKRTRTDSQT